MPDFDPDFGQERIAPLERMIHRCVDGELHEADERALLTRLEATPDHWRTLALAFVEQREFERACGAELADARPVRAADVPPKMAAAPFRWRTYPLAAACLVALLAFGLGRWTGSPGDVRELANDSSGRVDGIAQSDPDRAPTPGTDAPAGVAAQARTSRTVDSPEDSGPGAPSPLMYLDLVSQQDGGPLASVPVYSATNAPVVWRQPEPPLSLERVRDLRRSGYDVSTHWDLLVAPTEDGNAVLVPVSSARVRPSRF